MEHLILNFLKGKNLYKSYLELVNLLNIENYKAQKCYTLESAQRVQKNKKLRKELEKQIIDINAKYAKNSYEFFYMYNSPVEHEFPVENLGEEKEIILLADRLTAINHIEIIEPLCSDIAETAKRELKTKILIALKECQNKELKRHIKIVLDAIF